MSNSEGATKIESDPLNRLLTEVRASAGYPRATVIVAHGLMESMINSLVKCRCKNYKKILEDGRGYTHATKLVILNEREVLRDDELQLLDRFRKLRNDFAHGVDFELTKKRLDLIKGGWPFQLPHGSPTTDEEMSQNTVTLCLSILAQVWGAHSDELGNLFHRID